MDFKELVLSIHQTDASLRQRAASAVDTALAGRNWLIGRHIVRYEQRGADRAVYGEQLISRLADALLALGRGFSSTNLKLMRQFFLAYPRKGQTLSDLSAGFPLSWSQYIFLLLIADPKERDFYESSSIRAGWSFRELKRQFDASIYERIGLAGRKCQRPLPRQNTRATAADAVKDPYVLEFLGLKEDAAYSETDLESAIVAKLQRFLLELGKGFLFEARQKRITLNGEHFFVDLVFYNRMLRCYVLIDLKIGRLTHQDLGQLQMYVNYFDRHVKAKVEAPTLGILLCKTKSDALVEMTLPKDNRTIFASRYQLYLPSKEELKKQLR